MLFEINHQNTAKHFLSNYIKIIYFKAMIFLPQQMSKKKTVNLSVNV